ncbi:MAG: Maf-like protein [Bacteroidaceae bacterium]
MLENLNKYHIVLASNSPRRKEMLSQLGVDFTVKTLKGVDESYPASLRGEEISDFICRKKGNAYKSIIKSSELVITADTIVWLDGHVYGKPKNRQEAVEMLRLFSGKTHQVITGVCLTTVDWQKHFTAVTDVEFAQLAEDEICYYVDQFHPFDKAGAYGIQEWIGLIGVEHISGSYFNVVGLPVKKLYDILKKL